MQALFDAFRSLVLTILAIMGVGGFLFLFLPEEQKRFLTEKYPPEDREPASEPITRGQTVAILAICAGVLALAILGAVI